MMQTFSNMKKFLKAFSFLKKDKKNKDFLKKIEDYFASGGVIRIEKKDKKEWPKLIYPTKEIIRKNIKQKSDVKKKLETTKRDWQARLIKAQTYHAVHSVKKISSPLYWEHLAKYAADKNYRDSADKVKLPAHLVTDPRWEPMIRMFVKNDEYRQQLTETVTTSIVYKNDRKVAKFADSLQDFRKDKSQSQIDSINKKIEELNNSINALKAIQRWP